MYLDIVLILLLVLCMTVGLVRGVLSPLITFFSLLLSLWLVALLLDPCVFELQSLLRPWEGEFLVRLLTSKFVAGFLLLLIIYFVLTSMAEFIKRKLMNALDLRFSDRFMGLICGFCVGLFACLLLCVALLWGRTFVSSQANEDGRGAYDGLLASSQGYMVSMAVIDWLEGTFPQLGTLLPEERLWRRTEENDFEEL